MKETYNSKMRTLNYNLDEEIRSRTRHKNFEEVYKTYYGLITSIVGRYLNNHPGNIEDLVSDVFIKVMKSIDTFQPRTNLGAWIAKIAVHTSINYIRRERRIILTEKVAEMGYESGLEKKIIGQKKVAAVMDYLESQLPSDYFRPIEMFLDGHSYQSIAEKLDTPLGTVMSRIFRGRKIAKKSLNNKDFKTHLFNHQQLSAEK